jgi:hypothetical protein
MVSAVGPAAGCEGAAAGVPPCPSDGGVCFVEDGAVALDLAGGYTIGGAGCVAALRSLGSGKTSPVAMARFWLQRR